MFVKYKIRSKNLFFLFVGLIFGLYLGKEFRQVCQKMLLEEKIIKKLDSPQKLPKTLFVGVMTAKKYLRTRAVAAQKTWIKTIPGKVLFFSSQSSVSTPEVPVIGLEGVDDSYPPQRKSLLMLKYMHDHFLNEYEWFMRADDDIYVRGDKLGIFLNSINSSRPQYVGQAGQGKKEEVGLLYLNENENFCMGGPGIVFSRATLRAIAPHVDQCLKNLITSHEDVEVGRCVRRFADIPCTWSFEVSIIL